MLSLKSLKQSYGNGIQKDGYIRAARTAFEKPHMLKERSNVPKNNSHHDIVTAIREKLPCPEKRKQMSHKLYCTERTLLSLPMINDFSAFSIHFFFFGKVRIPFK